MCNSNECQEGKYFNLSQVQLGVEMGLLYCIHHIPVGPHGSRLYINPVTFCLTQTARLYMIHRCATVCADWLMGMSPYEPTCLWVIKEHQQMCDT